MRWSDLHISQERKSGDEHGQDDSGPNHRTSMWQDLTGLVPPILQHDVQERKDNEWEKPDGHTDMVHLRTAEPPKENRSDERLNEARKAARDG